MKILILHRKDPTHPEAGGGTLYVYRAARFLAQKGHEVTLACARYPKMKAEDNIDGVKILRVGNKYSVYFFALLCYLRGRRNRADIVIDVINGPPWFSPLYSRTPTIAVVFQTFSEISSLELSKPLAFVMCSIEKIIPYIYRKTPVITLSASVKDELVNIGFPKRNISIVPPGIELAKYRPGKKSSLPIVLYVGRLKRYKGVEYLIMAMSEVVKEIPDSRLLIVGKGDYEDELRDFVEKQGLESVVQFCGYVSEERKVQLMQEASVIVVPSIKEGWGIPIIEAAACGTPAIGTDTTGLRNSIIDGQTGFLVPYGKPKSIAEKIIKISRNDETRKLLSQNALKWAENFDEERSEKKILSIIQNHVR